MLQTTEIITIDFNFFRFVPPLILRWRRPWLRAIPEESLQECVKAWQRRLEKCIQAQGDYFESDML